MKEELKGLHRHDKKSLEIIKANIEKRMPGGNIEMLKEIEKILTDRKIKLNISRN